MRRERAIVLVIASALPLAACSVLFGLDGYAGSGENDGGGEAGRDAPSHDARQDAVGDTRVFDRVVTDAGDAELDAPNDTLQVSDCAIAPDPVAYWKIHEGSGLTVHDSTKSGITGAIVGGPVWVAGAFDGSAALGFDGTNVEYVDFGDPNELDLTGSMTLSAWFRLSHPQPDAGGQDAPILSKRSLGDRGWELYLSEDAIVLDVATSTTTYHAFYGGTVLSGSVWYHAVGVYDVAGPSLALYIDGASDGTQGADAGVPPFQHNSSNHVHLGSASNCVVTDAGPSCPNQQLFGGLITEVRVYAAALTPCQVKAIP